MLKETGEIKELTNEEARVEHYASGGIPTNPSSVNSRTSLKRLNLNWREADLREGERTKHVHRLHPYLGKYIPQLVEIFLRKYFKAGQTVFDPFSGSGTTLVQAAELGINSVGCDVSAFNILLGKAKTKSYDVEKVKREVTDILNRMTQSADLAAGNTLFRAVGQTDMIENAGEYLRAWFAPQALKELLIYRSLISDYEDEEILKVILSRAARSARLTSHFDLDFPKKPQTQPYYCFKHRRTCQPTSTALQFLKRYSLDTVRRIEEFSKIRSSATATFIHGDSRHANPGFIDGVITSPPYVGLIDYHEQHRYAYELLGITDLSHQEIGPASKGAGNKAKKEYQELITEVFQNCLQHMPQGGRLIVVAGDRHNLYPDIAKACGIKEEGIIQRHVNRRTGMRSGEFYESIFIWKKQ
jgi:DNA modification methylase